MKRPATPKREEMRAQARDLALWRGRVVEAVRARDPVMDTVGGYGRLARGVGAPALAHRREVIREELSREGLDG